MITCTRFAHYEVSEHPSMGRKGAHGFPFLSEKMWIAEKILGEGESASFTSMAPGRSTPYEERRAWKEQIGLNGLRR